MANSFNNDLLRWDVSSVTSMEVSTSLLMCLTHECTHNLPIWCLSLLSTETCSYLLCFQLTFNMAPKFNGDISTWVVSKVNSMNVSTSATV